MEDSSDIIDCPLYIECEELSFPCKGWIDFAYPILEEWKYNLVKAKNSYEDRFMLYFHEGSYWMEIYKKDTELKINFVMDKHTVKEYVCDYYDLINVCENFDLKTIIFQFLNNSEFRNRVVECFVLCNDSLVNGDLICKRNTYKDVGNIKTLKRLNPFYIEEEIVFNKIKETSC